MNMKNCTKNVYLPSRRSVRLQSSRVMSSNMGHIIEFLLQNIYLSQFPLKG